MKTLPFRYVGAFPIGDTDPQALPVPELTDELLRYYEEALGLSAERMADSEPPAATLARDAVRIGLAANGGDPEQASVYLQVSDVAACYAHLTALQDEHGLDLSEPRVDQNEDGPNKIFFLRDPVGLCYCLGEK